MLKLTIKPGEYLMIGEEIKVIFSGGSGNNMHLLIDAPKKFNVVRSRVLGRTGDANTYYKENPISEEAKIKINEILRREREKQASIK